MNQKNKTPIHIAVQKDLKEIFELLISKGVDVNGKTNETLMSLGEKGKSYLSYAAHYQSKEIGGKRLIHYAAENNSKEILQVLISKGANVNVIDMIFQKSLLFSEINMV